MRKVFFILAILDDEDVAWLGRAGRVIRPATDELLIRQGVMSRDLFFVLDGHVTVEVEGVGAIARLGSGEIVGEMSFIDRSPPSASIRCEAGSALLAVDKRDVDERLKADTAFAARLYHALAMFLSDRLRAANGGKTGDEADELDTSILDSMANAGQRFDMMLKQLLGKGRS